MMRSEKILFLLEHSHTSLMGKTCAGPIYTLALIVQHFPESANLTIKAKAEAVDCQAI